MRAMAMCVMLVAGLGSAAADTAWTVALSGAVAKPKLAVGGGLDVDGSNAVDAAGTTVLVTCTKPIVCTELSAAQVTGVKSVALKPVTPATAGVVTFLLDPRAVEKGTRLQIANKQKKVVVDAELVVAGAATVQPAGGATSSGLMEAKALKDLLATSCASTKVNVRPYHGDTAEMVVSASGNLLSPAAKHIDEDDELAVTVVADERLLPMLRVVRKSEMRTVNGPNIAGASVLVPKELLERQAAGAAATCGTATFTLRDFAAGTGEIEIRALTTGDDAVLGSLSFLVDPLYTGMFSLGAMWTHQIDPAFKLGADGTIGATERGKGAILYTLFYTPFLHGRRDFEKPAPLLSFDRLNPSVGLVLNDPLEHAIAGISYDLDYGVVLTFGVHVGHIHELAGLAVGDAFAGTADQIPVRRHWETTYFAGVSIDLRAAVLLLKSALVAK